MDLISRGKSVNEKLFDRPIRRILNFEKLFSIEKKLGKGYSAEVWLVTSKFNNKKYAIKALNEEKANELLKGKSAYFMEVDALSDLTWQEAGSCFPLYYDHFKIRVNNENLYCILMEYIQGDNLHRFIKNGGKFCKDLFLTFALYLFLAIDSLHSHDYVHRDIKPENIVVQENRVVLLDFGFSGKIKYDDNTCSLAISGSPYFIAPEVWKEKYKDDLSMLKLSDIFSAGVTLYYLLEGSYPFEGKTVDDLSFAIVHQKLRPMKYKDEYIRKIILLCLDYNPYNRPSASECISSIENYLRIINSI